jgi:hypothetical protein
MVLIPVKNSIIQLDMLWEKQYSVAIRGELPEHFKKEAEEKQKWQMV